MTSGEVNAAAGLEWSVYQTPAFIYPGGQVPAIDADGYAVATDESRRFKLVGSRRKHDAAPAPDYWLNFRDDSDVVIGVVPSRRASAERRDPSRRVRRVSRPLALD